MSIRILSNQLNQCLNQQVLVSGFLHKKRELSHNLTFLVLRDRKGLIQMCFQNFEEIVKLKNLQPGSILNIRGLVVEEVRSPFGVELRECVVEIVEPIFEPSHIEIDKNISHKSEHFETLFDYRPISLRNIKEQGVFKIQEKVVESCREFLKKDDFTEFRSPKLLAESTEGGSETFALDYFGKTATLAQSAQFYKQIMVGVFERVFEIGATYRAEPSYTPRHMTEFTTLDVEIGFIQSFEDVLENASSLLKFVAQKVWDESRSELALWETQKPLLSQKIPRITLVNLHKLYLEHTGTDLSQEKDPSPDEERFVCEYAKQNWNSEAVFITEFPASEMKFYHYKNRNNPEVCDRADLIFRGVEIATLSRREHNYQTLIQQLAKIGANVESEGYKAYLMAFRHGLPPHGGFGMGVERLTQKLIGLKSVKEATLFPRDVNRLGP